MRKLILISALFCSLMPLLQGCVPVAAVAAGATAGGAIIYDNRDMKTMYKDRNISYEAQLHLNANADINKTCHISVATFNHILLLVGQAPTQELKDRAQAIVQKIKGIKRIYNQITVEAPTSELTRANDSWLTTKVKTAMLAEKGLKSTQLKVVTENSVAYLMGLTTPNQGKLAATVASKVSGITKVVKLFEYMH